DYPNQIWVSDITCFKLNTKYFYTCIILDLFSRKIVAYRISKKNSTQLVSATFRQAYDVRSPKDGLIFHSDRGVQYASYSFRRLLSEHGVIQSFSASGKPHDNAVVEAFFASMKREELYRRSYSSEKAFRSGVDEYISFYNKRRPHFSLNYKSPEQFEAVAAK
ncbi:MAG: IS3 family transposase, partial [Angelakisella sp.]